MSKPKFTGDVLPHETIIEVIRTNSYGEVIKKEMTFGAWKNLKKQSGYTYIAYQLKFSQFKNTK